MADVSKRWKLSYPRAGLKEVVVEYSGSTGPRGHPVYIDADGRIRAEVTAGGFVLPLSGQDLPVFGTPIHAHPLP